ncbi:dihydrofolate reductase family protein [Mycetocola sp. 2940]|uniref:dihydrofolate reductase family protein n=1 Tax=Mycetocola sp. 2940 TaxID=3156452 RepID=UPI0033983224
MGNIIVQQGVSLDGYAADARGGLSFFSAVEDWTEPDTDQLDQLDSISHMVLGGTTYREFVGFWPTEQSRDEIIADKLNALDKVVFSRTLERAPWGGYPEGRVVDGDPATTLRSLAETAPGDLIVWGSLELTDQLFRSGGVDQVQLRICPVAIGRGRRVFPDGFATALRLLRCRTYDSGLIWADYALT